MDDEAPAEHIEHRYTVASPDAGRRLDRWLADAAGVTRAAVRRAIDQGRVRVDGRAATAGVAVTAGQAVVIEGPLDDRATAPAPWPDAEVAVLNEEPGWVAIDKPAGMAVHPLDPTQTRTALNAVAAMRPGVVGVGEGGLRSGVVHRLDVATSGVLVFATEASRWQRLREAFVTHAAQKRYAAIVHGGGDLPDGPIRRRLAVRRHRPARVAVVGPDQRGYDCSMSARVVDQRAGFARIEIDLHTGFLHQIRVCLADLGRPVVGDAVYGPDPSPDTRLMLHAERLAIEGIDAMSPTPFTLDDTPTT